MKKTTIIYVLFKEYTDVCKAPSMRFIHGIEYPLGDSGALNRELESVFQVLDFFKYEHAHIFYDEENVKGLLYQANELPEEYPSLTDVFLAQLPEHGMLSWRECPAKQDDVYYFQQVDVTSHLLGDMSQREKERMQTLRDIEIATEEGRMLKPEERHYEPCVLLQQNAIDTADGKLDIKVTGGGLLSLNTVANISELHGWLSDNRYPQRQYIYNPKHGDKYHRAQMIYDSHGSRPAAQLLTDETQTQELLQKAIGISRESDLWFYDHKNNSYIYFENKNEERLAFHGYHLTSGDKNYDKIDLELLRKVVTFPS